MESLIDLIFESYHTSKRLIRCKHALKHKSSNSRHFWKESLGMAFFFVIIWTYHAWLIYQTSNAFHNMLLPATLNQVLILWRCHNIEGLKGKYRKIWFTTMESMKPCNKLPRVSNAIVRFLEIRFFGCLVVGSTRHWGVEVMNEWIGQHKS